MSNFDEHIYYGWLSHIIWTIIIIILSIQLYLPLELIIGLIGISLPISLAGSIIPDIDHPSSKTYRLFQYLLLCSTIVLISISISHYHLNIKNILSIIFDTVPIEYIYIIISILSVTIGLSITYLFEYVRPPHRGLTHNPIFGIIISSIFCILIWNLYSILISNEYNIISSAIISSYLFIGFCSHIYADNMLKKHITSVLNPFHRK